MNDLIARFVDTFKSQNPKGKVNNNGEHSDIGDRLGPSLYVPRHVCVKKLTLPLWEGILSLHEAKD